MPRPTAFVPGVRVVRRPPPTLNFTHPDERRRRRAGGRARRVFLVRSADLVSSIIGVDHRGASEPFSGRVGMGMDDGGEWTTAIQKRQYAG